MTILERLYSLVDQLPQDDLEELNRYIQKRRAMNVWAVAPDDIKAIEAIMRPTHELTAHMTEEEINTVLDEALSEVRRDRQTHRRG